MSKKEEKSLEVIAKEAAAFAVSKSTYDKPAFKNGYIEGVREMIEAALISALTQMKIISDERENQLLKRIDDLSKKTNDHSNNGGANSIKTVLTSKAPEHREQRHQLQSMFDRHNKDTKERETNVVVIGIAESNEVKDDVLIKQFFTAAGVAEIAIKHVRRLKSSKNQVVSNSNVVQVSLINKEERENVLSKCSRHSLAKYAKVFAREDRTPSEQQEFNKNRAEMKRRNDELEEAGLLDEPFRNVIHRRTGRLCCINVEKSNEAKKYVFESATATLNEYRKRSNPDSTAPANTTTEAVAATSTSN